MDLRVDFAFKLFFATGDTRYLIMLLNAIFENKQIPRVVTDLTVVNPSLERVAIEDKLSTLDIRATLEDGTSICIEMHLYDVVDLKYKTIRSLARVYSEELESGKKYSNQNNVICISFADGFIKDDSDIPIKNIHSLFYLMERDGHEVLTTDLEMHHINMKKFVNQFEKPPDEIEEICESLTKWLVFITQKKIDNKDAVRKICSGKDMEDAMKVLTRISADKIERQRYQRRLDELHSYNETLRIIEEQKKALADKDQELAEQKKTLADKDAALADKDAALADKDAQIAKLLTQHEAR
jgi:predicted transposase/invertase (TIGR01784 family)